MADSLLGTSRGVEVTIATLSQQMSDRWGHGGTSAEQAPAFKKGWVGVGQKEVSGSMWPRTSGLQCKRRGHVFFSFNYSAAKSVSTIKAIFIQLN